MTFELYKASTLTGTKTDISNYVYKSSGIMWSREIDYEYTIPHPNFTIDADAELAVEDYLFLFMDSGLRMVLFIDELTYKMANDTYEVKTWDIIYKLKNTFISQLDDDWFNTTSFWTELSSSEKLERHKLLSYPSSGYWEEHYISALFLLQVMFYYCTGWEMAAAQVHSPYNSNSVFYGYYDGSAHVLKKGRLLFQWQQLKYAKKNRSTASEWEGATCLDVFLFIIKTLQLKFGYYSSSGLDRWRVTNYSVPSVPETDDDGYSPKKKVPYDGVTVRLSKLAAITAYYSAFTEINETTEKYPDVDIDNKKYKSFSLINNLELHYRRSASNYLDEMRDGGYDTFLKQLTAVLGDIWMLDYEEVTFTQEAFEERNALDTKFNPKRDTVDVTYLVETESL